MPAIRFPALLGAIALLGLAAPLAAQTTYRVTGTVSVVGSNLGTSVAFGDSFQMDMVFDETQSPWSSSGTLALYNLQFSTLVIESTGAGTLTWSREDPAGDNINHGFSVENSASRDALTLNGYFTGPALNGKAVSGYAFTFIDTTKAAFAGTAIPFDLTTGTFNSQLLDLRFDGFVPGQDIINFTATSFQVNPSAVPEPSTYAALAGLAMLGFVVITRRRRS